MRPIRRLPVEIRSTAGHEHAPLLREFMRPRRKILCYRHALRMCHRHSLMAVLHLQARHTRFVGGRGGRRREEVLGL